MAWVSHCLPEDNSFYVYLHRRKSDNTVFYVGKGRNKRAWDYGKRSLLWNRIRNKHGLIVEVLHWKLLEWYAYELENELILFYGRIDIKTGILANHSDGGEGESGKVFTPDIKRKMSESRRGVLSHCFDYTVYDYYNIYTKETVSCLQSEFKERYAPAIHLRTRDRHSLGWIDPLKYSVEYEQKVISNNSGESSTRLSNTIYNFVNIDTLEKMPMTVSKFMALTGKNPSNLTNPSLEDVRTLVGYTTQELIDKYGIDKIRFGQKDSKTYNIINVITGETDSGTREYLVDKYSKSFQNVLTSNKRTSLEGWRLASNNLPLYRTHIVYEFINIKTNENFKGTRLAFEDKYKLAIAQLFRKKTTGLHKSWMLK